MYQEDDHRPLLSGEDTLVVHMFTCVLCSLRLDVLFLDIFLAQWFMQRYLVVVSAGIPVALNVTRIARSEELKGPNNI